QRAKASVEMIKSRVGQLDGNHQATQQFSETLMRLHIGAEAITAEQDLAGKERVPFAFKEESVRQGRHFVTPLGKPAFEVRRFAASLLESKIAADEPM